MATPEEINFLRQTTIELFRKAYQVHQDLGDDGKMTVNFNDFGDLSLQADWEAEEVFINGCREVGIPIVISSEEHGEVSLGDIPKYRGVLDGIDGTNAYKMGTGPYGSMFVIFEGVNPRYKDYLVSGILEYPTGRILIAAREEGALILDGQESRSVKTSRMRTLDPNQTRILIDGGIEFNRSLFEPRLRGFKKVQSGNIGNTGVPWGASSIYYFRLATGEADLVLVCTRKRNLELAVAFGILNEVGAIMVDRGGESFAEKRYLEYGQGVNEYLPVISAATLPLANQVIKVLS